MNYNENDVGRIDSGIFGLPFSFEQSELVILPCPLDVSCSFRPGTSDAADEIRLVSSQIDLFDPFFGDCWKKGIFMLPQSKDWKKMNKKLRKKAEAYIHSLELGKSDSASLSELNQELSVFHDELAGKVAEVLDKDKRLILLGGDHSSSFSAINETYKRHQDLGVLHIDAHMDLRPAYMGLKHSHASVMYNVMEACENLSITQVGIRDCCSDEWERAASYGQQVNTFTDWQVKDQLFEGKTWKAVCQDIVETLPDKVYLSLDIDGLNPSLCPSTGTPVPGGLSFEELRYLFVALSKANKRVVGADLVEVGVNKTDSLDAIVGTKCLYLLCCLINGGSSIPVQR